MSAVEFRTIRPDERGAVLDLLAHWLHDRAFFARYFEHDPTFRDDLCFVATDDGQIISTLQVFRKQVRIEGSTVDVGCVGNVFTAATYRGRGIASVLLKRALAAMQTHGFDLSLLFAVRLAFYSHHGWQSHLRHLVFIEPNTLASPAGYAITPFRLADLDGVMALYDAYNRDKSGTVVRDRRYWLGQVQYAGNVEEDFLLVKDGDRVVAYARGTPLYDFYVIMEHACVRGQEDALTQLICRLHATASIRHPGTIAQLALEPRVQQQLRERGLALRMVEDVFWMWQIISPQQLAEKLGVTEADLDCDDVYFKLFPPERSVYWISDRF